MSHMFTNNSHRLSLHEKVSAVVYEVSIMCIYVRWSRFLWVLILGNILIGIIFVCCTLCSLDINNSIHRTIAKALTCSIEIGVTQELRKLL